MDILKVRLGQYITIVGLNKIKIDFFFNISKAEIFNRDIFPSVFDYKITFVNSQDDNT